MINRGLKRRKYKDPRRFSYTRTFGAVVQADIPDFVVDKGLPIPCQNDSDPYWGNPALPNGCTGFSVAGVAETDLKQPVDPRFTYDKTLLIQNGQEGDTCTLQDAFKSGTVYGVRLKGETDEQALVHRRSPYFEVDPNYGQDWFEALLSAVYTNQRPVSVGTTWLPEWESFGFRQGNSGIMVNVPTKWIGGHAWNIVGKKTIGGVPFLVAETWNGTKWGDGGYCYFSREVINATMKIRGSDALTNRPAAPGDIVKVKISILQVLISLYYRLLAQFV